MANKYTDVTSVMQVIGCVYKNPKLLDLSDKYMITDEDFSDEFHRTVFGAIYKIYELGAEKITLENIADFLSSHPKAEGIYNSYKGNEWLLKVSKAAIPDAFDYYYNRLKKMTLLRMYDSYGISVADLYDPDNILDTNLKQKQEEWLDNSSLIDIALKIDKKIDEIKSKYIENQFGEAYQAGDGIYELIERLKEYPEVGIPLYGPLINTVTRGARLKKFYLRSAATGVGKTRSMIADACYIGCSQIYDETFGWIKSGSVQPTVYITTEQEKDEIQTMMLAFLACVDEEHILNGYYLPGEEERVLKAAEILSESPLYIEEMPDFSLQDIEDTIKKNIRDHDVKYVFHDYIHTSLRILEEISKKSGGVKLREDNILYMLSIRLKDLCNKYGVFIMSATQLNTNYQDAETPDQNLLRGAKSIADKVDFGAILLNVKNEDIDALQPILSMNTFENPDIKISIYKNRRGRWRGVYLWCKGNLGCCRIKPMFCTAYNYEIQTIEDLKIIVDEESAFEEE